MLDYSSFKDEFEEVIRNAADCSSNTDMNSKPILDQWAQAKENICTGLLGGQLQKSLGYVEIQMSDEGKDSEFTSLLNRLRLYGSLRQCVVDFLQDNKDSFWLNTVTVPMGDKMQAGMKITRALKFLIEDKEKLDSVQTDISMALQQNKMCGELVVSVHPLDFLSSSENFHNWRSCHALDGEYRGGNLSYMVDKNTLICYIKSAEDVKLPYFTHTWNNKKWRMLLEVNDSLNFFISGRQYPFNLGNNVLAAISNGIFGESVATYDWSAWSKYYIKEVPNEKGQTMPLRDRYIPVRNYLYKYNRVVKDGEGALNYNDLKLSTYYTPYYSFLYNARTIPEIVIGGEPTCPCCGLGPVTCSEDLLCEECGQNSRYTCTWCGELYHSDEVTWVSSPSWEGYVCEYCLDEYFGNCECCDNLFPAEDLHEHNGCWYCSRCLENQTAE